MLATSHRSGPGSRSLIKIAGRRRGWVGLARRCGPAAMERACCVADSSVCAGWAAVHGGGDGLVHQIRGDAVHQVVADLPGRGAERSTPRIATLMNSPTRGSAPAQPTATPLAPASTARLMNPSLRACKQRCARSPITDVFGAVPGRVLRARPTSGRWAASPSERSLSRRLPEEASRRLPSRGQVAVRGSINGYEFCTVLEPDGLKGHWMKVDQELQRAADICAGDIVNLAIEAIRDWPEPGVPPDLATALAAAPQKIRDMWNDITPMARWEWVHWVNATASPATRQRRVEVSISKMNSGKRRPCCFDLSACTDPALSKNGKLRGAT